MNAASIADIKKELKHQSEEDLFKLCVKLAQYKKENKELLSYLLFESRDEEMYISKIKETVDLGFKQLNKSSFYLAKKTIRKQLRILNKHIKFSANQQTEIELLLFFSDKLIESGLDINESKVLWNMLDRLRKSIHKVLKSLHEDIQYDYLERITVLDEILK